MIENGACSCSRGCENMLQYFAVGSCKLSFSLLEVSRWWQTAAAGSHLFIIHKERESAASSVSQAQDFFFPLLETSVVVDLFS